MQDKEPSRVNSTATRYRLREPGMFGPPDDHFPLDSGDYLAAYEPVLELLDELGIIEVPEWGSP